MPFEFFRVFSFNSLHSVDDFSISNENFVNGLLATSFNAIAIHSVHARALHKHSCKHPAVSLRKHYHFHVMEKFVVWPFFSFICSGCFFFCWAISCSFIFRMPFALLLRLLVILPFALYHWHSFASASPKKLFYSCRITQIQYGIFFDCRISLWM